MKSKHIIAIAVALFFSGVAFYSLMPSTTMYVTFADARKNTGKKVQIYGAPVRDSIQYDRAANSHSFELVDKTGDRLRLTGDGPPNTAKLKEADQVVAKGVYSGNAFHASELLFKCPSKYKKMEQQQK